MAKYMTIILIVVFVLLGISMFLIGKFCKKKPLKITLAVVVVLMTLYCVMLSIDVNRTNSLKEPIFAKENGSMGSMIRYDGLGYTIGLEMDINTKVISQSQMSMFGNIIAAAITNSDDKNEINVLENINNKIIEYFESGKENSFNLSANYIDKENNIVIVELLNNSKEEQDLFKKLVIDSEYIKFVKGGPYSLSKTEKNNITKIAFNYLEEETQKRIINKDNPNIKILDKDEYDKFICGNNLEIKDKKIYSVEFFNDFMGLPNNVIIILDYNTKELLGFPLLD